MYYLKRNNAKDFSIDKCKGYDSNAPLVAHKARARAIAEYERVTCEVVDEGGNVVFVALAIDSKALYKRLFTCCFWSHLCA